jgi:hypothetical protein
MVSSRRHNAGRARIVWMATLIGLLLSHAACTPNPAASTQHQRIQQKAQRVQQLAPQWVAAGGNPAEIERLGGQADAAIKAGKPDEAEAALDQLLAIVERAPAGPATSSTATGPPGTPRRVKLGRIPDNAAILFINNSQIYVMDRDGGNITQITFESPRHYETAAVSQDRRYVVANHQDPNPAGDPGGRSRVWVFDLEAGTETQLVPQFITAGNGGVDWDPRGFVYFAGKERNVVAQPRRPAEFISNAAANDVYRVKYDGTGLQRLTQTTDRGEADVSVSEDGTLVAFMALRINPPNDYAEIWVVNSDGTNPRLVYKGGKPKVASVHDPEVSPDNSRVAFSQVNANVTPNWRCPGPTCNPDANTAHDVYTIRLDGSEMRRVTKPGPISIMPDWQDGWIVHALLSEAANFRGVAIVRADGSEETPRRIKDGAWQPKWIPKRR